MEAASVVDCCALLWLRHVIWAGQVAAVRWYVPVHAGGPDSRTARHPDLLARHSCTGQQQCTILYCRPPSAAGTEDLHGSAQVGGQNGWDDSFTAMAAPSCGLLSSSLKLAVGPCVHRSNLCVEESAMMLVSACSSGISWRKLEHLVDDVCGVLVHAVQGFRPCCTVWLSSTWCGSDTQSCRV